MSVNQPLPSRRWLLGAAAVLPLAGCGGADRASEEPPAPAPSHRFSGPRPSPSPRDARLAELERRHGARLGVYAVATGTGATVTHRADERFAFCSTFKTLAAAGVLDRHPLGHLDTRVTYTRADVDSISPVTERHIATGMTVRELCDAAVRYSDGTAGNLLMRDIGGPAGLTAYLRELGDTVSRMDHYEPELNDVSPGDPHDTTTPHAVAAVYRELVLGDALTADRRTLLTDWLLDNATAVGARRIRAALPEGPVFRIRSAVGCGAAWPSRAGSGACSCKAEEGVDAMGVPPLERSREWGSRRVTTTRLGVPPLGECVPGPATPARSGGQAPRLAGRRQDRHRRLGPGQRHRRRLAAAHRPARHRRPHRPPRPGHRPRRHPPRPRDGPDRHRARVTRPGPGCREPSAYDRAPAPAAVSRARMTRPRPRPP